MRDQKTFEEHLDEIRDLEDSEENLFQKRINRLDKLSEDPDHQSLYSYPLPARIGLGVVVLVISTILGYVVFSSPSGSLFVLFAASFVMMITMSKTGIALRREFVKIMEQSMEEAQQQQQNGTQQQQQNGTTQSQTEQVVCQSCGWKNPKANNFCHDCGNEI
jgi:uncharacterized protein YacL